MIERIQLNCANHMLYRVWTLVGWRDGTYGSSAGNLLDFNACGSPSPGFYGVKSPLGTAFATSQLKFNGSVLSDPNDPGVTLTGNDIYYAGNIGYTVASHVGTELDSGLVFGLFSPGTSGRNHRAYVSKAAKVLLEKLDKIIDEQWLTASGVFGIFEANTNAAGDIKLTDDQGKDQTFICLRQQRKMGKNI